MRSYGPSLLNVSCWTEEVLHHKEPFISACQASSHLTSAAIMLHQVGQLPSLATEQGAGAGFKIKCTVSGFHSQELGGLMLYWLQSLPVSITNNNSQVNDRWCLNTNPPGHPCAPGSGIAVTMAECRLNKVYREGKSESLQHEMTFKQVTCGSRMRDNDAIIYSPVSDRSKTLSSLNVYVFSWPHVHCAK